jgi:N-acetylglucosamine malate deacetylase 1
MKIFACGCHPDDIEFMMAGTLILFKRLGWEIHYMNIANGNCGTQEYSASEAIRIRREEAMTAAASIGAVFHESITDDLTVFFCDSQLRKVAAVVRKIRPDIMLIQSPQDYMEDHMNAARLAVTAAFAKGMPNYVTDPPVAAYDGNITLYHALPYDLKDGMRQSIIPEIYVDISSVMDDKKKMLALHRSQKEWLDKSQGLDSYVKSMEEMTAEVGRMSGRFFFAEGWRRHLHRGYSTLDLDPLSEALGSRCSKHIRS